MSNAAINIRRLNANEAGFNEQLNTLLAWETVSDERVNNVVKEVLHRVKTEGDAALLDYTADTGWRSKRNGIGCGRNLWR